MEDGKKSPPAPHVLIFPLPAQGHLNSMLKLAELLALSGLKITFLNSTFNHNRLVKFADILPRFTKYPQFQFKTVPDGLPDDHPRSGSKITDLVPGLNAEAKPALRDLLLDIKPPVDCIISDAIFGFVLDIGKELGIPVIYFRTSSVCAFWTYYRVPNLVEAGELPIQGNEHMNRLVKLVPGMESFLRFRDLPSFCRAESTADPRLQMIAVETRKTPRAHALIFNTFEELDGPILSHIRTECPNIFTLGPLHTHLNTRLSEQNDDVSLPSSESSNSLWKVDRSCISWLDRQDNGSVIYVSFGSITVITREQLMEIWYGLVNSKRKFLWVIRPDSIMGREEEDIPVDLKEATKERGCFVDWAPQEEVLAHLAIGGFFTHSGWNSTLEGIATGIPMICWPYFADQQVNSRFVEEVWKVGLDMKDVCERKVVEKMVNDLMVERREEFVGSAKEMEKLAAESVSVGGSSHSNLNRLIEEIILMSSNK